MKNRRKRGRRNIQQRNDEMTFEHTQTNRQASAKRVIASGVRRRAQREKVRVCACGEVFVCTDRFAFMAVATVWTRNCQKEQKI